MVTSKLGTHGKVYINFLPKNQGKLRALFWWVGSLNSTRNKFLPRYWQCETDHPLLLNITFITHSQNSCNMGGLFVKRWWPNAWWRWLVPRGYAIWINGGACASPLLNLFPIVVTVDWNTVGTSSSSEKSSNLSSLSPLGSKLSNRSAQSAKGGNKWVFTLEFCGQFGLFMAEEH